MLVSLQEDNHAAISGTDATPVGFVFDEVAIGVRSSAILDTRWDNFQVSYVAAIPEPTSAGLLGISAMMLLGRRRKTAAR